MAFDYIINYIKKRYSESLIQGGEMVGPVAAQSIGEPSTQLSVLGSEKITLMIKKKSNDKNNGENNGEDNGENNGENNDEDISYYSNEIGEFIDTYFDNVQKNKNKNKDNAYINPKDDIYVMTVDPNTEKTKWQKVCELSRHPANGGMVKVTTKSGRIITTTKSHSHLTKTPDKIIPIRGDQLNIGDRIPIVMNSELFEERNYIKIEGYGKVKLDGKLGWVVGAYVSEGNINYHKICITNKSKSKSKEFDTRVVEIAERFSVKDNYQHNEKKEHILSSGNPKKYCSVSHKMTCGGLSKFLENNFGHGSANKRIATFCFASNKDFIKGIIQGYFDSDGNINASKLMVRVHSISRDLIEDVARLLTIFGIGSTFGIEDKSHLDKPNLQILSVLKKHIPIFTNKIGSCFEYKRKGMNKIC